MKHIDLLLNIIEQFNKKSIGFGETKLVKFAYLAELDYFRRNRVLLTDAKWQYYKFGPYPVNFKNYLKSDALEIGEKDPTTGFAPIKLKSGVVIPKIPTNVKHLLIKLINNYGNWQLNDLLNYVYFQTEPMMNVHERGEFLDFSTVMPTEYYEIKPFKNVESAKKNLLKKIREKNQHAVSL